MNPRGLSRRNDPRWITEDALFAIHAVQIERYGGAHGVIDANVVRSALARATNRFSYDATCDMAGTYWSLSRSKISRNEAGAEETAHFFRSQLADS